MAVKIPILSIVIPVFNRPDELKIMVDSIIASSFVDWELIVVDDGSEEDTLELLNQYAAVYSKITIIHRELLPKGAQQCRNIGLQHARGEYIAFLDSDDMISTHCLEDRVNVIKQRIGLDFMVFKSGVLSYDGKLEEDYMKSFGFKIGNDDIVLFAQRNLPFIVFNNIYRRKSLINKGLSWDINLMSLQDSDFNLSAILAGLNYDYATNSPDYFYRKPGCKRTTNSIASDMYVNDAHIRSHLYAIDKFYNEIQKRYGDRYNNSLYFGALRIFSSLYIKKANWAFAEQVADIIHKYDKKHARILKTQIFVGRKLELFLSNKLSYILVMIHFYISDRLFKQRKMKTYKKNL